MMGIRVVAALALLAGSAAAQPTPNTKVTPADLVRKAIGKSQAGDHLGAIENYLQAYTLDPKPALLSNIGSEYEAAKKPVEALRYFCMYLEKDPTGTNAPYATSKAKALAIDLGQTDVTDESVCKPPKQVEPPKPDPKPTPPKPEPKPKPVATTVEDRGAPLRLAGIGAGAAGALAIGLGVYFGSKAKSISDNITNHCMNMDPCPAWPEGIQDMERTGQSYENKQIAFLVAGGVAIVGGTVLYAIGVSKKGERRVAIVPVATPTSVGVVLGRGF